ncbi:P-loop containing nucleoside triphosphate hydrolase protein [Schizophyllum amplum]|uniref:P-loop containing nucleoside triphosphate hydrolase protein n=1 Tax=Schizophyllum amplum TaxID=97359 RepID=A0A550C093_9AGAR|nr:P-loop containing nucleoside triphosphate hydrolase protein [Auriculariopsis ampla]
MVSCRDGSIEYPNGTKAIDGESVDIKPGQIILLTGTSNSGKTSFLNALLRLMPVSAGELLLDGRPVTEHDIRELRRSAVYLTQDDALLPLSLRDNVFLGTGLADDTDSTNVLAQRALDLAGFVGTPDLTLDSLLERVAMIDQSISKDIVVAARAFARLLSGNTRLVLVDNAFAELDGPSELALLDRILAHRGGATVIVSGRLAYLGERADLILCMDKGKIVQRGTHEVLVRDDEGVYAKLYDAN